MRDKETIVNLFEFFVDEIYMMESDEEKKLKKEFSKLEEKLWKTLNEEQIKLLDNILGNEADRTYELNKRTFVYAFSLAIQIFVESLGKNESE